MFEISRQGAIDVVAGELPLNAENAEALMRAFEKCLADGQPRAVLDLQAVPLIDSVGLETLLDIQDSFEQRTGSLKLASPNPLCSDILIATGIDNHFEVYPEVKSAVASFLQ